MKDRCQKRYSVYSAKTDTPLIIYGTARACAEAMGITKNSFYRSLMRTRQGKINIRKWAVYEDEVEELEEEAEVQEAPTEPIVEKMPELEHCPFCGRAAFIDVYMDTEYVNVEHNPMCLVKPNTWVAAYGDKVPLKTQINAWNWRKEDGK